MGYNIYGHEYRHFKKQTDNKYTGISPTIPTSDKFSDEKYNELTGFNHEDSLYADYIPKPRPYRKHTKSYEQRFSINPDQTFVTVRSLHGSLRAEFSGKIHSSDNEYLLSNINLLPVGLTLTLTEVFKRLERKRPA